MSDHDDRIVKDIEHIGDIFDGVGTILRDDEAEDSDTAIKGMLIRGGVTPELAGAIVRSIQAMNEKLSHTALRGSLARVAFMAGFRLGQNPAPVQAPDTPPT